MNPTFGFVHPNVRRILGWSRVPLGDFPNEFTTGPSGALTPVSGTLTINTNGTVVENQERTGNIVVNADNVVIRNCKIIYGPGTAIQSNGLNLLVEDCEIDLQNTIGGTGIESFNYTARRCDVYGGENLMWAETNVTIEDCYLHDTVPYNPIDDPHTDGIQMPTVTENVLIKHNTIYGGYVDEDNFGNSAITSGDSINVRVLNNLLAGGGVTLRCPSEVDADFEWHDNRFSRIFTDTVGGFGPVNDGDLHVNSGNVYHETGLPVDID